MSLDKVFSTLKTGRGRGNWDHQGIPGHRGGSLPGGGSSGMNIPEIQRGMKKVSMTALLKKEGILISGKKIGTKGVKSPGYSTSGAYVTQMDANELAVGYSQAHGTNYAWVKQEEKKGIEKIKDVLDKHGFVYSKVTDSAFLIKTGDS